MRAILSRIFQFVFLAGLVPVVIALLSLPWTAPAFAALICPSCYGLEKVTPQLYVDSTMPAQQRLRVQQDIEASAATVAEFFGSYQQQPVLLACATAHCDRKLGGRGARATTYTAPFLTLIRLAPRGLNKTILSHELAHVELHHRTGLKALLSGKVPAWFDEGVAVIVSRDKRYLNPGHTAEQRCMHRKQAPLPDSPLDWGPASGKRPLLYAEAACEVLKWIQDNGGRKGLLAALQSVRQGRMRLP